MKLSKKILIISGVSFVVLAIAIGIVLMLTLFSTPNKSDFAQANSAAAIAKKSSLSLDTSYEEYLKKITVTYKTSTSANIDKLDASIKKDRESFQGAISTHLGNVKHIGDLKAARDDEFRSAYEAYKKSELSYADYLDEYTKAYVLYARASSFSCADIFLAARTAIGDSSKEYTKKYAEINTKFSKDCLVDLQKLSASSNKSFSKLGKAYKEFITTRQSKLQAAAAGSISLSVASREASAAIKPYEKAIAEFVGDREEEFKEFDQDTSLKEFYALAREKAAGAE
jgi:hypothetical protein